ncbi:hypothetical protein D3C81_1370000 [compost metagenome]
MADPVQGIGQQAPERNDGGEAKQDGGPFLEWNQASVEFDLGQFQLAGPARERAGIATELLFQLGERAADQAQYALLGSRLRLLGAVAQLLQIGQQLAALLIVFQVFDDFVQGLGQRLAGLGLGFTTAKQARQAGSVGRGQEE